MQQRIDPDLIKMSVDIVRDIYGYGYSSTPSELAELVSDEFECICLPEDVAKYCVNFPEEQDAIALYRVLNLV